MIELRALTRRFGELTAVDGLSFTVGRGELFGLVGPDGAGKTTTLRMLAGVLRPTSGDALVAGASVARDPERVKHAHRLHVAALRPLRRPDGAREPRLLRRPLPGAAPASGPARLARLFEFSNLGPFEDRLAGQLSGGMKQKLGLSCALIHEPEILLLDEPTFGVDPVSRRELWLIVHEMVGRGVTAIVSTAYMDEAERFDRLALLHRGRVLALDTPGRRSRTRLGGTLLRGAARTTRAAPREAAPGAARASADGALFGDRVHLIASAAGGAGAGLDGGAPRGPGVDGVEARRSPRRSRTSSSSASSRRPRGGGEAPA